MVTLFHRRIIEIDREDNTDSGAVLSLKEREALLWVARGKTDNEIAVILGKSPEVVRKQVKSAMAKLGHVATRTQAAMIARDRYLIFGI